MEDSKAFRALEEIGWGPYNTKLFIICGMVNCKKGWLSFDAWGTNITYTLEGLKDEWQVSNLFLGIICSSYQIGIMIGGIVWGILSDNYGRKVPFHISGLTCFLSSLLFTFAFHPYMMIAVFFLLGFCLAGEFNLASTIVCEFCPPSKRFFLTLLLLFFSFGSIFAAVLPLIVELFNHSDVYDWRLNGACLCILEGFICISRFWIDETPAFYFRSNQVEEAEKVLNKISIENRKTDFVFGDLDSEFTEVLKNTDNSCDDFEDNKKSDAEIRKSLWKKLWCNTVILGICVAFSLFTYIGILFYILQFLSFLSTIKAYIILIIIQFISIPGVLVSARLVDTSLGRRWTTSLGFIFGGIFIFIFLLCKDFFFVFYIQVMIITSLIYISLYMGFSSLYTIPPESFPTEIRSTGCGIVNIIGRIGGIISPIVGGLLLSSSTGVIILMCLYAASSIACGLLILYVKETSVSQKDM